MNSKKKLKDLKVSSFVTSVQENKAETIKGGKTTVEPQYLSAAHTCHVTAEWSFD